MDGQRRFPIPRNGRRRGGRAGHQQVEALSSGLRWGRVGGGRWVRVTLGRLVVCVGGRWLCGSAALLRGIRPVYLPAMPWTGNVGWEISIYSGRVPCGSDASWLGSRRRRLALGRCRSGSRPVGIIPQTTQRARQKDTPAIESSWELSAQAA